jgi:NAD(P)-dependent dehydrogenase (short-subunit alcohol dehydrogenase family)
MNRFEGKRVLVTGASRNTGFGIARRFAEEGAVVIMNGTSVEGVAQSAAAVREATGARIIEAAANIADRTQVETMFGLIERECGGLDVLVNNAAHLGIGPNFLEVKPEFFAEVIGVNLLGVFHCSQLAARMMVKQGKGAIVHVGSNTSERPILDRTAYVAAKGGVDSLTRAMAIELGPLGVRVNMVAAGYINTERWETLAPGVAERRRKNVPLGREASAEEIAAAIMFFASEESSRVTGARLTVDGGVTTQMVPPDCCV